MIANDRVPDADSRYVTVDGTRLHYLQAGRSGPPVVLLHGGGVDDATLSWKYAIPDLAEDHRVYALDWPSYGESEPLDGRPSIARYVDVLDGFLDAAGVPRPVTLVGISMGGGAALGYAVASPDDVDRLVLVDSYGLGDVIPGGTGSYHLANAPFARTMAGNTFVTRAMARTALSLFVHESAVTDEFVDEVHLRLKRPNVGPAFVAFQRAEFSRGGVATDYSDVLADLDVPTLLVHGADDPLLPADLSRRAAERLPNAELEVVENCGHWPPRERPATFNRRLLDFLEK